MHLKFLKSSQEITYGVKAVTIIISALRHLKFSTRNPYIVVCQRIFVDRCLSQNGCASVQCQVGTGSLQ